MLGRVLGIPLGFGVALLLRLSGRPLAVGLMYHRVDEQTGDPSTELVPAHGVRLFRTQLRFVRAAYRVVPASRLIEAAIARRRGQRIPIAVTFDDDLACHRAVAMPVLERLGVPATFFLSGASLEHPFSFWWERLQRAVQRAQAVPSIREVATAVEGMLPALRDVAAGRLLALAGPDPADAGMRLADVCALADGGFEIGFHTLRHYRLTTLDDDQLGRALREGRETLAAVAGVDLAVVAYPHGKADARVAAATRAAGYRAAFTSRPGAIVVNGDSFLLPRLEPSFSSAGGLAWQLAHALLRANSSG